MRGRSDQRIYVVEDELDLRASLIFQLQSHGYDVTGYETGEAFFGGVPPEAEGCAIIDVNLPGMSGLEVLQGIAARGHHLAAVVVTGRGDVSLAVKAMQLGAKDFIEKPFARGAIASAVRHALDDAGRQSHLRREAASATLRVEALTQREREVFDELLAGKLGKQIAIDLQISPRTVEVHRARIMAKLGASTLSEMLRVGLMAQTATELSRSFNRNSALQRKGQP
ncbi:DNA-binding response regulator [Sphingomonas sp. DBB INV C78]|uniref:response regulator transcription factor n=1 Tax=Sphingomonas sp. DBB INV C78 TaxID=3349434 RepID=UPI0036D41647